MKRNNYFNQYIIITFLLVIFILILFYFKNHNIESFSNQFLSEGYNNGYGRLGTNNYIKDNYIIKNSFDARSIILKDCKDNYSIDANIDPSNCSQNSWVTNAGYLNGICGDESKPLYKATVNNKVYYGCQDNAVNSYQLRWKPINNQIQVDQLEVKKLQSADLNKACIKVASRGKREIYIEEEDTGDNNILSKASIILKLETDTVDSGTSHVNVTTVGFISFTRIDNKNCTQFNNSLSNYLKFKFNNIDKFTICFWVYITDDKPYTAVSLGSGTFRHHDPVFQDEFSNGYTISNYIALPNQWSAVTTSKYNYVGKWVHIAYTCNQEDFKAELFINGNLNSTGLGTGKLPSHVNSFVIGRSGDNYRALNGYIRYFCVFNFILKPCQVKDVCDFTEASNLTCNPSSTVPSIQAPIPAPIQAPIPAPIQAPIPAPIQAPIPAPNKAPIPNSEADVQKAIQEMGVCPANYKWIKTGPQNKNTRYSSSKYLSPGGWRCAGGSHYLSDAEVNDYIAGKGKYPSKKGSGAVNNVTKRTSGRHVKGFSRGSGFVSKDGVNNVTKITGSRFTKI